MVRRTTGWWCTCKECGDDIKSNLVSTHAEFKKLLLDEGWECLNGKWLCPACAEDARYFMKGEN